ncbi:MAG TPA: PadR family transcriptional regulator [Longimicrobiales bacterium]|nr:PadR family transcriptional regulator [Longimicrobiales bacterium]
MGNDALKLFKGTLDLLVMRSLASGSEMHGFEILDWIQKGSDDAFLVEEGALYPALHRLEKRGLLAADWGISEKGRRAKYYRLTPRGRTDLAREQLRWDRYVAAVERLGAYGTEG